MKPPAHLHLRLLGRLALACGDDARPIRLSTRKAGALLAYLAMRPEQSAPREELATLLWGSCSDQQARQSLRQALVSLRRDLPPPHGFAADADMVRLQPGQWSVDARELEEFSKSSDPEDLARAARSFGGDLLAGLDIAEDAFAEWLGAQRRRVQTAAMRLCQTYAERPDLAIDGDDAIAVVEKLLAIDQLREDWQHLALMLYARFRGSSEALAQAEAHAARLQRERGGAPAEETRVLVERIRAGEIATVTPRVAAPMHADGSQPIKLSPWRARGIAAGFALVAIVLTVGLVGLMHRPPAPGRVVAAAPADPWQSPPLSSRANVSIGRAGGLVALAVMPFASEAGGGASSDLAADVITDDLTDMLSRVAGFRVISHETAMTFRGQRLDPAKVGAELGVPYLLQGTVAAEGASLRVSIELVDTSRQLHLWSGRFERTGADRAAILDDIVRSIGRELQIEVTQIESEQRSSDPDVHALIYQGYAAISRGGTLGLAAFEEAKAFFTQALAKESDNPRALTGLAWYHAEVALQLLVPDSAPHLATAESMLQQVIARHPGIGGPYHVMGLVELARAHFQAARPWFEHELELDPSQAHSYAQIGRILSRGGNSEQGLKHIQYAMRLSPRDPAMAYWLAFAGVAEVELEHYDEAMTYLERGLVLNPGQPRMRVSLVAALALSGNLERAHTELAQLQKRLPHLSNDQLFDRIFGKSTGLPQLRAGLRLAMASFGDPPPPSTPPVGN